MSRHAACRQASWRRWADAIEQRIAGVKKSAALKDRLRLAQKISRIKLV
jgi:hypothetical protein